MTIFVKGLLELFEKNELDFNRFFDLYGGNGFASIVLLRGENIDWKFKLY